MIATEAPVEYFDDAASLDILNGGGAIGVLAPHPDDETLGCGGLIAMTLAKGFPVVVVVLTDGAGSHPHSTAFPPHSVAALRSRELSEGGTALGLEPSNIVELRLSDGALPTIDPVQVIGQIVKAFRRRGVQSVFVTGPEDTHPDHRAAFDLAQAACDVLGASLWTFPVRAHLIDAFAVDPCALKLDIRPALARKLAAIACHKSQIGDLIDDDAEGFRLTADDLDRHRHPYELFRRRRVATGRCFSNDEVEATTRERSVLPGLSPAPFALEAAPNHQQPGPPKRNGR